MTSKDFPNVLAVLEAYGSSTVQLMKDTLSEVKQTRSGNGAFRSLRSNAIATGNLRNSITFDVVWKDGVSSTIEFTMDAYGKFVDSGRRPGKQPPLDVIKEWTRIKGLPEGIAYPIARKIGQEGIAARPFIQVSIDKGREAMIEELSVAYSIDISNLIKNKLNLK